MSFQYGIVTTRMIAVSSLSILSSIVLGDVASGISFFISIEPRRTLYVSYLSLDQFVIVSVKAILVTSSGEFPSITLTVKSISFEESLIPLGVSFQTSTLKFFSLTSNFEPL